jgi:LPPG:FO 2-phospho-L-lactate transferase
MLAIAGLREELQRRRQDVVAVSPIIAGAALKGPADRLLGELGYEVSCVGVAQYYEGLIGTLVIDEADADLADRVAATGCAVRVTTTIMSDASHAAALVRAVLA